MKRSVFILNCLIGILALSALNNAVNAEEPSPRSIVGTWTGKLEGLRIVFKISENSNQELSAVLISPDQSTQEIPVEKITFQNGTLHLEAHSLGVLYDGKLRVDGSEIDGKFFQGKSFSLNLRRTGEKFETSKPSRMEGPLTARVLEDGMVIIYADQKPVGIVYPDLFTDGWKQVRFTHSDKDPAMVSTSKLPGGEQVTARASVDIQKSGLHIHYVLSPSKDIKVIAVHVTVEMPYQDWVGSTYQWGDSTGTIPNDLVKDYIIAQGDSKTISLGPASSTGLKMELSGIQGAHVTLQDDRKWSPYLTVFLNHGEPGDKTWDWKAGSEKVFDFTLSFNHEVVSDSGKIAAMEPKKPFPYNEEEVSFDGAKEGVKLAGLLTLPKGKGPFPAVLLIQGSGQVDHDETVYGHRP